VTSPRVSEFSKQDVFHKQYVGRFGKKFLVYWLNYKCFRRLFTC